MKLLHAADLHLDSPLRGLAAYEGAPVDEIRGATRRALENLVQLALDERAALVLLAGDLYDGDWRDYNTGLYFARQMSRLREARIPVVLLAGNHDAASQITKHLALPENVRILATREPQTIVFDELGLAVHGQGFATREVTADLSAAYPPAIAGLANVGVLHTSLDGRPGHEPYAPCTVDGLRAKGYDYWALGHVHKAEIVSREPWIVFPGNTQGRHARETGPKGCARVTIEDGSVAGVDLVPLDVVRWAVCEVDAQGARDADEVVERAGRAVEAELALADERLLAARIRITGLEGRAFLAFATDEERWTSEIRARATDLAGGRAWLEKIELRPRVRRAAEPQLAREAVRAELPTLAAAMRADPDGLARVLADLQHKLPKELRLGAEALDLADPTTLTALLEDAVALLDARLAGGEEEA